MALNADRDPLRHQNIFPTEKKIVCCLAHDKQHSCVVFCFLADGLSCIRQTMHGCSSLDPSSQSRYRYGYHAIIDSLPDATWLVTYVCKFMCFLLLDLPDPLFELLAPRVFITKATLACKLSKYILNLANHQHLLQLLSQILTSSLIARRIPSTLGGTDASWSDKLATQSLIPDWIYPVRWVSHSASQTFGAVAS